MLYPSRLLFSCSIYRLIHIYFLTMGHRALFCAFILIPFMTLAQELHSNEPVTHEDQLCAAYLKIASAKIGIGERSCCIYCSFSLLLFVYNASRVGVGRMLDVPPFFSFSRYSILLSNTYSGHGKNTVSTEFCRGPLYCPDFLTGKSILRPKNFYMRPRISI